MRQAPLRHGSRDPEVFGVVNRQHERYIGAAMAESDIRVSIIKYPDRRHWVMRYIDPVTGKQKARSTGTTNRREADRAAAKWQAELQEGRYQAPTKIPWEEFRERYESEKVSSLADNTAVAVSSAFNHLERLMRRRSWRR